MRLIPRRGFCHFSLITRDGCIYTSGMSQKERLAVHTPYHGLVLTFERVEKENCSEARCLGGKSNLCAEAFRSSIVYLLLVFAVRLEIYSYVLHQKCKAIELTSNQGASQYSKAAVS